MRIMLMHVPTIVAQCALGVMGYAVISTGPPLLIRLLRNTKIETIPLSSLVFRNEICARIGRS
jgi:hypothetical protein